MTDDTAKARQYSTVNGFILPERYSAFLDGRLSLREELDQAREEIARLEAQAQVATHRYLSLEAKADQMRADLGQARAERDAALEALRGVVSVADRKTKEFDAARACLARLPQAAERAQARRDVVAAARAWAHADPTDGQQVLELDAAVARLDALESGGGGVICPHCKKLIQHGASQRALKRIKALSLQGYSAREIEKMLFADGMVISFGSIARVLRKDRKPTPPESAGPRG